MSVRQYIGARYVPKFFNNSATGDGTWAANTAYEPLTIVTWNGNSYTSKKAVPASIGNPSSNSEYWASTGLYNAQVEVLREEVEEINGNLADLTERVNRKVIVIGDSYCEAQNAFISQQINYGLTRKGGSAILSYKGGAGFLGASQGKNFANLFDDAMQNVTNSDEISDVLIIGGCNDASYTYQAINDAKNNLLTTINNACPKATIHIMCIGGFVNPTQRAKLYGSSYIAYSLSAPAYMSYPDAILPMLSLECYESDGTHPNATGVRAIAYYIVNKLLGNSSTYAQFNGFDFAVSTFRARIMYGDGQWQIHAGPNGLTLSEAVSYTYNNGILIDLGTVTRGFVPNVLLSAPNTKTNTNNYVIPITIAVMKTGGVSWDMIPGELSFAYDTSDSSVHCILTSATAPASGSNANVRILPFSANVLA